MVLALRLAAPILVNESAVRRRRLKRPKESSISTTPVRSRRVAPELCHEPLPREVARTRAFELVITRDSLRARRQEQTTLSHARLLWWPRLRTPNDCGSSLPEELTDAYLVRP